MLQLLPATLLPEARLQMPLQILLRVLLHMLLQVLLQKLLQIVLQTLVSYQRAAWTRSDWLPQALPLPYRNSQRGPSH